MDQTWPNGESEIRWIKRQVRNTSRSHAILEISILAGEKRGLHGKLSFVDLAGPSLSYWAVSKLCKLNELPPPPAKRRSDVCSDLRHALEEVWRETSPFHTFLNMPFGHVWSKCESEKLMCVSPTRSSSKIINSSTSWAASGDASWYGYSERGTPPPDRENR